MQSAMRCACAIGLLVLVASSASAHGRHKYGKHAWGGMGYGASAPAYQMPAYQMAPAYAAPSGCWGAAPAYSAPSGCYGSAPAYSAPTGCYGSAPGYASPGYGSGQAAPLDPFSSIMTALDLIERIRGRVSPGTSTGGTAATSADSQKIADIQRAVERIEARLKDFNATDVNTKLDAIRRSVEGKGEVNDKLDAILKHHNITPPPKK